MFTSVLRSGAVAAAFLLAAPALAVDPVGDPDAGLQALRELNLIVFDDLSAFGQEVEGKTFVGGNVTGNGTNWGVGNATQGAAPSNRRQLTVNGNNNNSGQINNGSNGGNGPVATSSGALISGNSTSFSFNAPNSAFDVGGNLAGNSNVQPGQTYNVGGAATGVNGTGGATVKAGGPISGNQNGAVFTPNQGLGWNAGSTSLVTMPELTRLEADLNALSQVLSGLSLVSNPSTITLGGQGPTFNAVGGGNPYALFNISINSAWNEINFNAAGLDVPIIVNVSGSNIIWDTNPVGGYNSSLNQSIIWNFYEATNIRFDRIVHGSILAPLAQIANNTPLEGSVAVRAFTMRGEVHLGTFNGDLAFIEEVPEPATWAMMIAGFGLIGCALRRRRSEQSGAAGA